MNNNSASLSSLQPTSSESRSHSVTPSGRQPAGKRASFLGAKKRKVSPSRDSVVERIEALGIPESEINVVLETDGSHIIRWVPEIAGASLQRPSTSEEMPAARIVDYDDSDGSGVDSDCDDEFESLPIEVAASMDIPDDAALEAPVKEIVEAVEKGMDDEADRLLGMSPNFIWREDFESFRGIPELFSGPTPGPLRDYDSAYDAFVDIWDKDIIDCIVCETNRYAQQTIKKLNAKGTLKRNSRLRQWEPTNADEIMVLFAIFQFMGIDSRTSQDEYWKKGILYMPIFRSLMTYNRFILLKKFLHFVDNSNPNQEMPRNGAIGSTTMLSRRLLKLAPILTHLGYKFDSLYQLKRHISIDESLTLFKGRLSWVQTIRTKSARFGIKSYELCESDTGYMARFQIYTGKSDDREVLTDMQISNDLSLKSTKSVLELLQGLEHRGHCVTMDNFYNCPSLARYLKSLGFDCVGVVRSNRRYVPNDIAKVPADVPKGTIIARHSGDVSIVSWKDARMVNIISTFHNADTYIGSRAGKIVVKPICVKDYNKYMGGIDLKDHKLSMYLLERKRGVKWYMKMFKRLMNVSILNSLIMYNCSRERRGLSTMMHREFRYALAESLINKHRVSQKKEVQKPVEELIRLKRDIVHDPSYHPGSKNKRRCRVCYARTKTNKNSHFRCVPCDVFLCLGKCWTDWHTLEELKPQEERGRKRRCDK